MKEMKKKRVMFVCHGNICRSPMAEFVLKDMAKRAGVADQMVIASSATSTEEIYGGVGNPMYPPARAELSARGIAYTPRQAVQLRFSDYEKYDVFAVMDEANYRNARRMLGGDPEGKVRKLMSYAGRSGDVADPWYSRRFDVAYDDIYEGCVGLMRALFAWEDVK